MLIDDGGRIYKQYPYMGRARRKYLYEDARVIFNVLSLNQPINRNKTHLAKGITLIIETPLLFESLFRITGHKIENL